MIDHTMVRHYKIKTEREALSNRRFVDCSREGKSWKNNPSQSLKMYNISLNTVIDHIKGRRGMKSKSQGWFIALPEEVEISVAAGLLKMEKLWFGLSKQEFLSLVQYVEIARRNCMNQFMIHPYSENNLEDTIQPLGLTDKPHLIFYVDKICFARYPSKPEVVGGRGLPSSRTTSLLGRDNISVLLMVSAAGEKVLPLLIFKGKNVLGRVASPARSLS
ncbi:hypothetical protein PR048_001445 [Dryococelus australis]|uniref:Uncharacterized protein n=1 Tax=Dryococelus australis TaxID=614101 RepID=A0ABQ9IHE1_9NEOP|nr:hypothetical protein PR048_001445 [Dryococelus australis]